MKRRRHQMRKQQRRDSTRDWIRSGAKITVTAHAKRYGVDRYTAYDDLTAVGYPLPSAAQRWAKRPPSHAHRAPKQLTDDLDDNSWFILDGRRFFVVGYTSGGAPYGIHEDEMKPRDRPSAEVSCGML